MYTFIASVVFSLLLAGILYRKNIQHRKTEVAFLIVVVSLVVSGVVNGVVGSQYPYRTEVKKVVSLADKSYTSEIQLLDTVYELEGTCVSYDIQQDDDSSFSEQVIDLGFWNLYPKNTRVEFLPEGDTVPELKILHDKRDIKTRWVSKWGSPRLFRRFEVYLPRDSVHEALYEHLTEIFYKDGEDDDAS